MSLIIVFFIILSLYMGWAIRHWTGYKYCSVSEYLHSPVAVNDVKKRYSSQKKRQHLSINLDKNEARSYPKRQLPSLVIIQLWLTYELRLEGVNRRETNSGTTSSITLFYCSHNKVQMYLSTNQPTSI